MKHFFLIIFLLFPLTAFSASEKIIRWGDVLPAGSPSVVAMEQISAYVANRTDGRILIKVFPSGQLGSSREMVESVTFGSQEMVTEGAANVGQWYPPLSIMEAPYLWRDLRHIEMVMDGPVGKHLKNGLLKKTGLRILGFFYNGVRHLTTKNIPVNSILDMKGLKLRVPENEVFLAMAKSWGSKPTPMNFSELYLALRQNIVDGQENPLPTIDDAKFYEVQKYLILTRHIMTPRLILISDSFWKTISDSDQHIIMRALEDGIRYNNAEVFERERELLVKFKGRGMAVIYPDVNGFRNAVLKDIPARFENKWGSGLFRKIVNTIPEDR